jgi:antitoxin ChpS
MHTANLRKVGGSTMLAIPPAILDLLQLKPGAIVDLAVEGKRLVIQPRAKPRYTLDELLAQCNHAAPKAMKDRSWLNLAPAGREL